MSIDQDVEKECFAGPLITPKKRRTTALALAIRRELPDHAIPIVDGEPRSATAPSRHYSKELANAYILWRILSIAQYNVIGAEICESRPILPHRPLKHVANNRH